MHGRKQKLKREQKPKEDMEPNGIDMSFKQIMKDVELFSSSHGTWKERKVMENKKVVALGGKPVKKQRLPLSVARVQMKKQKEREEKMLEQNMILGRFGGKFSSGSKKPVNRRKPEDRVLRATEGNFRNGVLDVKHLLRSGTSRPAKTSNNAISLGPEDRQNKGNGKKGRGKKKSNGRKH